ncbi:D-amino acid dehydrogenase [Leifsonia kafniensis]|uniref:D-amino acid dehydrogenase n=1 Tax=Leifsonia kafniensis TaxID=475957 RepID=A0ABP7KXX5_9MICO
MKTIIVGGGIVGVTAAYYLAKEGIEVTLLEGQPELALDASAGNAGLIAPGHSFAWASPSAPGMMIKSLFGTQSAIRVRWPLEPRFIAWGLRFLRECTAGRARSNSLVKLSLSQYSQALLENVISAEGIDCHYQRGGVVYLYRSPRELAEGIAKMQLVRDHGQKMVVLTPSELGELEPALRDATGEFAGGILGLTDTTANSVLFAHAIADKARELGVEIRLGTPVEALLGDRRRVTGVQTSHGELLADAVVVAAGAHSPQLMKGLGINLPVYPAKGYSLTIPVISERDAPQIGGLDERTLVAWSRMGDQLRMSSTAEFAGFNPTVSRSAIHHILTIGKELFPGAADWDQAVVRTAFRPMTPAGPPIIGASKVRNLYYNTGHGHMGWTMACGSAQILADQLLGRTSAIDTSGFAPKASQ